MGGLYTEESFLQVLLVTGVIGGGAAWLAGRAIAITWRPYGHVIAYMILLGGAVRFTHFALFEATLISVPSYVVDTAYLILVGSASWRITRVNQMVRQYPWLYERNGLWAWRPRKGGAESESRTTPV
ncbi:MAG TPA: hypothetical protein VNK48_03770 [Xanthobacteraceae bacterium]|nr:hypothetical protein [Xanthobacteraceae bacterium]